MSESGDHRHARREYDAAALSRADIPNDPLELFGCWIGVATDSGAKDATAMVLATSGSDGVPAARVVLLKHYDAHGLVFFTDYRSQKGAELSANPVAAGLFYWRDLDRQVRVTGPVARVDQAMSDAYFASRPADSRFSAAASRQSEVVADRATLEAEVARLRSDYPDDQVPRPFEWGGYRLVPQAWEFWQGREGRLHDRFRYSEIADGWQIERLMP